MVPDVSQASGREIDVGHCHAAVNQTLYLVRDGCRDVCELACHVKTKMSPPGAPILREAWEGSVKVRIASLPVFVNYEYES